METHKFKFKNTELGLLYNVNTNKIIKYNKKNVNNILEKLRQKYEKKEITKIEYDKLLNEYNKKVTIETEAQCLKNNKILCNKNILVKSKNNGKFKKTSKTVCLKDNIKNRLMCEVMLSEDQFDSLIKDNTSKECTRKNTDHQYTEYLFAVLLKNPQMEFDISQIKQVNNINLNENQKKAFLKDFDDSYSTEMKAMKKWFNNAKREINKMYQLESSLSCSNNIDVFLTGKNIMEEKLKKFLDKSDGRDKINKGDVYLLCNDKLIGFSIKKSTDATLVNWSIEKQVQKFDKEIYNNLIKIKKEFLLGIGIDTDNRVCHRKVRDQFNNAMKGDNLYKNFIKSVIETDEKYFLGELIKGIGSNTSYTTYMFSGSEMIDLNEIYNNYKDKLDKNKLTLLSDNMKDNTQLIKYNLKQHYSNNAGKIWYYLNEDGHFNYRIEIRTKGNCYASLQFQLHKC